MRIHGRAGTTLALVSFGLVAAYVVVNEHWGHALGLLPYLILAACPLLHLFSHGGHGHEHRHPRSLRRDDGTVTQFRGGAP